MSKLKNKIAFVTGGSRGIGAAIVRSLAKEGASVIFTYVNSSVKAESLVNELKDQGLSVKAIKADTSRPDEINAAITTAAEFTKIDILVNSAGLFITGSVNDDDIDLDALRKQWDVNVFGIAHTVRAFLPKMNDGGRIITIGSTGAVTMRSTLQVRL